MKSGIEGFMEVLTSLGYSRTYTGLLCARKDGVITRDELRNVKDYYGIDSRVIALMVRATK